MKFSDAYVNDRRIPGIYMHQAHAIYNFCRECRGWDMNTTRQVDDCQVVQCPLYTYRTQKQASERHHMTFGSEPTLGPTSNPKCHASYLHGRKLASIAIPTDKYTRRVAIKTMCKSCMCVSPGEKGVVQACTDKACHLYPYRTGSLQED